MMKTSKKTISTTQLIRKRAETHGNYRNTAEISSHLMAYLIDKQDYCADQKEFSFVQRDALSNICKKLARIIAGDPNFIDHWVDIAGYAELVVEDLTEKKDNDNKF